MAEPLTISSLSSTGSLGTSGKACTSGTHDVAGRPCPCSGTATRTADATTDHADEAAHQRLVPGRMPRLRARAGHGARAPTAEPREGHADGHEHADAQAAQRRRLEHVADRGAHRRDLALRLAGDDGVARDELVEALDLGVAQRDVDPDAGDGVGGQPHLRQHRPEVEGGVAVEHRDDRGVVRADDDVPLAVHERAERHRSAHDDGDDEQGKGLQRLP